MWVFLSRGLTLECEVVQGKGPHNRGSAPSTGSRRNPGGPNASETNASSHRVAPGGPGGHMSNANQAKHSREHESQGVGRQSRCGCSCAFNISFPPQILLGFDMH